MLLVDRVCPFTGKTNVMNIPLTQEEYESAYIRWSNGMLIQNAFPTLNDDEREFIKSGITPVVWDQYFGGGE